MHKDTNHKHGIDDSIVYPYMPKGKRIHLIEENNPFMQMALEERKKSNDLLYPSGAVVIKNGNIIGKAHNKAGYSWRWLIKLHQKGFCPRRWFKRKTGTCYWMCPGCATNEKHAEVQAVTDALDRYGVIETNGADLYLYGHWWCCEPCWDAMISAGIKNVFLLKGAKERFDKRTW